MDERDVVAVPTVNKSDVEGYNIFLNADSEQEGSWIKADRAGTGCFKLSRKSLDALAADTSLIDFRGKQLYNICQYTFEGDAFIGEDIYLCHKLKTLGFDIWVNTNSTCMHIGPKVYTGNFRKTLEDVNQSQQRSNA